MPPVPLDSSPAPSRARPGRTPAAPRLIEPQRLRELCWEIGSRFGTIGGESHICLAWVQPHLGFVQWHVDLEAIAHLQQSHGSGFDHSRFIVRFYDVTDILFDGTNAHSFFDVDISQTTGHWSLHFHQSERMLLSEVGFRLSSGEFCSLARSNAVFFDRERPCGRFSAAGRFISLPTGRSCAVPSVFAAPAFEELQTALIADAGRSLSITHIMVDDAGVAGQRIEELSAALTFVGEQSQVLAPQPHEPAAHDHLPLLRRMAMRSVTLWQRFRQAHAAHPVDLVICHDWHSALLCGAITRRLHIPVVLMLHSIEEERAGAGFGKGISARIRQWELAAAQSSALVIISREWSRDRINDALTGCAAGQVPLSVITPPATHHEETTIDVRDIKRQFGLHPEWNVVLFANAIDHDSGADLLANCLGRVCREYPGACFIFVGEGPLRWDLEATAGREGRGDRVRFFGMLSGHDFDRLFAAVDAVIIPARRRQDSGLALRALHEGKAVLTTHQAGLPGIIHGRNGLIAYDNPGSVEWGVKELLSGNYRSGTANLAAQWATQPPPIEEYAARVAAAAHRLTAASRSGGTHG